mmetsp:Transcript_6677/g.9904  ORF Transcript_6677/g.9904 Transcript_6677/m.9904 type:complete len:314 (+) Transcript_6677:1746-2687(+)
MLLSCVFLFFPSDSIASSILFIFCSSFPCFLASFSSFFSSFFSCLSAFCSSFTLILAALSFSFSISLSAFSFSFSFSLTAFSFSFSFSLSAFLSAFLSAIVCPALTLSSSAFAFSSSACTKSRLLLPAIASPWNPSDRYAHHLGFRLKHFHRSSFFQPSSSMTVSRSSSRPISLSNPATELFSLAVSLCTVVSILSSLSAISESQTLAVASAASSSTVVAISRASCASCSATADGRTPSVDVSDEYATFLCCSLACNALCASANAFAAAFRAETADSTHFEAFLSRLLRVVVSSHAFLCRCMAFFSCFSVSPR